MPPFKCFDAFQTDSSPRRQSSSFPVGGLQLNPPPDTTGYTECIDNIPTGNPHLYAPNDPLVDFPDHETGPTGNSQSSFEFLDSDFISASDIFTTFPEPFQDTIYSDLLFSSFLNSPAVTIDQTIEERTPDTAASPQLQGD